MLPMTPSCYLPSTAESLEKNFIIFGIDNGVSTSKDVVRINLNQPEAASIVHRVPVETMMRQSAAAAVYCNSLFVTGIGRNCDEIWRFSATSSTWIRCASLVQDRRRHGVAFVDHVLYICSGYAYFDETVLDTVEAYDALCDECQIVGRLVFAVESSGICISFRSSIYVFGGMDGNGKVVNRVQVYDTKSSTCTLLSKRMPMVYSLIRAAMWEKTVILLGRGGCCIYNLEADVWEKRNQFKTDADYFGLTISNGLVFVIGGGYGRKGPNGNTIYICRDDVRCVPVMNILNDEAIDWRLRAKLPKPLSVSCCG